MSHAFFQGKLTWVVFSAVSLHSFYNRPSRSCQYLVLSHQMFGPMLMMVWEGLQWLLVGSFVSYWLWHIALRVNLEPHPGPNRWPCAHHLIIIMGLWLSGFPCVQLQHTLSHVGFMHYLDFHLTLSVDISPLCQLSLLVGSEGFFRALASSCACRKRTSVLVPSLYFVRFLPNLGLRVTLALDWCGTP